MAPTGPIQTRDIQGEWEDITHYDDAIHAEADPVGWPIENIRSVIAIESAGDPRAVQKNDANGWSYGLMQIVPYGVGWDGWHKLVREKAGLNRNAPRNQIIAALYDSRINIAVGVAILESFWQQYRTLDAANSAFFVGNPDWSGPGDSVNRNTPAWYRKTLNALIAEQEAFQPAQPDSPAQPSGDVLDLLFGGKPYTISATYGQLVTWSCPGCYDYFPAYGLDSQHHWAYDVAAQAGDGAPLYAPFNALVVCAGTEVGQGAWDTGCAAFGRLNNYGGKPSGVGAGRLELLHEDGDRSLILGHVLNSRVRAGDRVKAGDVIGQQGGMNASHVHVEGRWSNGQRIGDPRVLFGGGPLPVVYAERLPIPQPEEFDVSVLVTATQDGVPVLQRADLASPAVNAPLNAGDEFRAVYQVIGNDKRIYWVSTLGSRVPVEGTSAPDWATAGESGIALDVAADEIEAVRVDVDARLRAVIASLSAA